MSLLPDFWHWGTTEQERELEFGCDEILSDPDVVCWRAVDVNAPAHVAFRWLCQLRAAPYSYDWIDHIGRRSPRHLIQGLDQLALGQVAMSMFEVADFERDSHITFRLRRARSLMDFAVTYRVVSRSESASRLVVKLIGKAPSPRWSWVLRNVAPPADFVMMRRQLLTLKGLAEDSALNV
jgi:hypothetical protein